MVRSLAGRLRKWGFSWERVRDNRHGEWWVLAQMLLIFAHFLPPTPSPRQLDLIWPSALRIAGLRTWGPTSPPCPNPCLGLLW